VHSLTKERGGGVSVKLSLQSRFHRNLILLSTSDVSSLSYTGFYINLTIRGLAALNTFMFFHTPKHAKPADATLKEKILQMDPIGTVRSMGCIILYLHAMQYGGQIRSWNSSTVIGLLVGFASS